MAGSNSKHLVARTNFRKSAMQIKSPSMDHRAEVKMKGNNIRERLMSDQNLAYFAYVRRPDTDPCRAEDLADRGNIPSGGWLRREDTGRCLSWSPDRNQSLLLTGINYKRRA